MTRLEGFIEKGWGNEYIFATNEKYCGKLLNFRQNSKFSMHFHAEKDETWFVLTGKFLVRYIDTINADTKELILEKNSVWRNLPLVPHQIECLEEGTILEVSTPDSVEDNYRIMKGDSQK